MKRLPLILAVLLLPFSADAAIINAASQSKADVAAAIALATYNDTVVVPGATPSTVAWDSGVTLTKGISLMGPGRDLLHVTCNSTLVTMSPDATTVTNDYKMQVAGFNFDGNRAASVIIKVNGTDAKDFAVTKPFSNFVIQNNTLRNTTISIGSSGAVFCQGQQRGTVYNNNIINCDAVFKNYGNNTGYTNRPTPTPTSVDNSAVDFDGRFPYAYGDGNTVFFEGNTVTWDSSATDPGWFETGQGGRVCCRYNKFVLTGLTGQEFIDQHGFQNWDSSHGENGQSGSMQGEYYGNIWVSASGYRWWAMRGGAVLMFNNIMTGSNSGSIEAWDADYDCCEYVDAPSYPSPTPTDGVCSLYDTRIHDTYCVNNTNNGTRKDMARTSPDPHPACATHPTLENAQFWNYNASTGTGSPTPVPGVGVGANPPTGYCSNGSGYLQISTGTTPNATPSIIQASVFWTCVSNVWTPKSHPYPYPNPLVGQASASPTVSPSPVGTLTPTPTPTPTTTPTPSPTPTPTPGIGLPITESGAGALRISSGNQFGSSYVINIPSSGQVFALAGQTVVIGGAVWGAPAATGISLNGGNIDGWHIVYGPIIGGTTRSFVAYGYIVQAGPIQTTITFSPVQNYQFSLSGSVFRDIQPTALDVDGGSTSYTIGASPTPVTDTLTPTMRSLVLGVAAQNTNTIRTLTAGSGYTTIGEDEDQNLCQSHHFLYKILTTAALDTPSVTIGAGSGGPASMQTLALLPFPQIYPDSTPMTYNPRKVSIGH